MVSILKSFGIRVPLSSIILKDILEDVLHHSSFFERNTQIIESVSLQILFMHSKI